MIRLSAGCLSKFNDPRGCPGSADEAITMKRIAAIKSTSINPGDQFEDILRFQYFLLGDRFRLQDINF